MKNKKQQWKKFEKNHIEYSDEGIYIAHEGKNGVDIDDSFSQALDEAEERGRGKTLDEVKQIMQEELKKSLKNKS